MIKQQTITKKACPYFVISSLSRNLNVEWTSVKHRDPSATLGMTDEGKPF